MLKCYYMLDKTCCLDLGLVPGNLDMIDNNHDKGLAGSPALLPKEL